MTDHIRFTGPADILAYVPHSLGHQPTESFVVLTMNGQRLGATLRIDAPADAPALDYAQRLVTYLTADETATATLLVIYSNETAPDGGAPYRDHVDALSNELTLAGMPLKDAWIVTGTHWRNYLCTDPTCCPPQTLETIRDSNGNAAMIYTGSTVTGIPEPAPFTGDPATAEAIAAEIPQGWPEDLNGALTLWDRVLNDPASPHPGRRAGVGRSVSAPHRQGLPVRRYHHHRPGTVHRRHPRRCHRPARLGPRGPRPGTRLRADEKHPGRPARTPAVPDRLARLAQRQGQLRRPLLQTRH
jgi:hypothetical protein